MRLKKKPSQKAKKRYIVFRVHSSEPEPISYENMRNAVWNSLDHWLGEQDLAQADVRIIRNLWDRKKQTGFVQCSHRYVDLVKTGMSLVRQIGDQRATFQTIRVSGTIKAAKSKIKA
jgi:RNase P/RNase MRP subunit POP5